MRRIPPAAVLAIILFSAAACTGKTADSPSVPRLAGSAGAGASAGAGHGPEGQDGENPNAVAGDGSAARRAKLHAAADCIRRHGLPGYQDPVLTADGYVYTDEVAVRDIDGPTLETIQSSCRALIVAADYSMRDQGPPPPKLIQAGVKSAECMRAHGLPDFKDPTADSHFTPGKGFGLDPSSIPPGGKENPTLQRAAEACRPILDEEEAQSSLGNLGHA
jgi:hypothetical protein